MGTWGAGNFDNDGALDFAGELADGLMARIDAILSDTEGASDLDECGESELMPSVALISLLCDRVGTAPPTPEKARSWRDDYVCIFDNQIGLLDPSADFERERRAEIVRTFDELLRRSLTFYERGGVSPDSRATMAP